MYLNINSNFSFSISSQAAQYSTQTLRDRKWGRSPRAESAEPQSTSFRVCVTDLSATRTGADEIHHGSLVLSKGKLYIRSPVYGDQDLAHRLSIPFRGGLIPKKKPSSQSSGNGLVSYIEDGLYGAWLYIDIDTHEVRYGEQSMADSHIAVSWGLTQAGSRLTVNGWEGFMAVKEQPGLWALSFDVDDNGLCGKITNKRALEVEIEAL